MMYFNKINMDIEAGLIKLLIYKTNLTGIEILLIPQTTMMAF